MKKFIIGCFLMLCGIIGGTGWVIAYTISFCQTGQTLVNLLDGTAIPAISNIISLFYFIAIIGFTFAIFNTKTKD